MATDFLRWRPLAGLNREDSEDSLAEMEVRNSKNFLWEDNECKTRPGVAAETISPLASAIVYGNTVRVNDKPYTFVIGADNKLYRIDYDATFVDAGSNTIIINSTTPVSTEITGAGVTWGDAKFHNAIGFNGVVLIGNSTGGLVRWDPATSVYTVISTAKFRYITAHLSRAVGGYDTNATALIGPRTVGYSKVGDETVWSGGFGAGTTLLADSNDQITGMQTLHNVVTVCRSTGFHLGFSTGDSTAPFRFEKWSDVGPGLYFPGTVAVENNVLYFAGRDNIYTFDLNKVEAVGNKIRKDLSADLLNSLVSYRGFISRAAKGNTFRTRYNLVGLAAGKYHYTFDTENGTWAKHLYAFTPGSAWNRIKSNTEEGPNLCDSASTSHFYTWDSALACESAAFILSGTLQFGDAEKDYTIRRMLVRSRDNGAIVVTLTISAVLNDTAVTANVAPTTGTVGADGLWKREWFDTQLVGQEFTIQLDITSGKYSVNLISEKVAEAGDFRG